MPLRGKALNEFKLRRAHVIRNELLLLLGGECEGCGTTENLEFNHLVERTWIAKKLTRYRRMLRYRKEAKLGLINLLCEKCNKKYEPDPF